MYQHSSTLLTHSFVTNIDPTQRQRTRGVQASYRQAPRDYGDDLAEMGRRQTEHYKQRGRHRFGIHYLQNFFFLVHTCGIVKSFHPQFKEEGTISVAELLNAIYPTPGMMIDTISLHTLTNTLLT